MFALCLKPESDGETQTNIIFIISRFICLFETKHADETSGHI